MNESAIKKIKNKKWDEINGMIEDEISVGIGDSVEDAGAGPSISRNYLRGIEDQVEQNDNNFDGIINNVPTVIPTGIQEAIEQEKKSVLEKLKEPAPVIPPIPERKPAVNCPELDLH